MNTILRNFFFVIKRFKMATLLNVAGLTVASTAFLVLVMQVGFEYNFDRMHATSDRVYRVEVNRESLWGVIHSRGFAEAVMHASPHIEAATLVNPFNAGVYFSIGQEGERKGFRETVATCSPDIIKVFDIPIIQGDADCLRDPEKVIIPLSLAQKLFGAESSIGKVLHAEESIWTKSGDNFTVGAVYRDFPANTQLKNILYAAMDANYDINNFNGANFLCYLLLDSPLSKENVTDSFNGSFDFEKISWKQEEINNLRISLTPLADVYFLKNVQDSRLVKTGNRETSFMLIAIALLTVIIAAINFTNFSTALAPMRIRSVNTQKVLGSSNATLRTGFLLEAVALSLLAFAISLFILYSLEKTDFLSFIDADLRLSNNLWPVGVAGACFLLVGLIAGVYPAYYMTSFPPALALKGNVGLSPKGKGLRTALTGFQFIVSTGLIIAALFIQLQQRYMQNYATGFDKDRIVIVELSADMYKNHRDSYVSKLKSFTGIEDVAFSRQKAGAQDSYSTYSFLHEGKWVQYHRLDVSHNFLSVMGIPVIEGRGPGPSDERAGKPSYIFNKMVRDEYGIQAGRQNLFGDDTQDEVLGFTDNIKFRSLREEDHPFALTINSGSYLPVSYIRLKAGADYPAATAHIRKSIAEIDPGFPAETAFYDAIFNELYRKEEKINRTISSFGLLAIVISIAGVFGLAVFETQFRRKEIGIRKVMGAGICNIILTFNKTYMHIVCVSFLLAAPASYYAVTRWLENFAFKIPLYWWVFAIAFLAVAGVTLLTVTYRNWQAASANPVDSIKTE
ncbi:MAG: ABC transporter permease [Tannerellaceae bacterium]|jgi:putative ABC transport system permease protein|nr:ABC transporter permease [Tannerellaceae bacterium]